MSQKNLDTLFNPQNIPVIGESVDEKSISYHIIKNLIDLGFKGIVRSVNPAMRKVLGVEAYRTITDIPHPVDLALVATYPEVRHVVLRDCGEKGVKGVAILAPDYTYSGQRSFLTKDHIRKLSAQYGFRVLGPNSLGFIRPAINLNASLSHMSPQNGNIAIVSESGIFSTTFLEHIIRKDIGLSYFISLGSKIDINIADIIDFLGEDGRTRAIFLFLNSINNGRSFMSATRNFARKNPIVIVKPTKADSFSCLSLGNSDLSIEEDLIYDALFKRAGCLRVSTIVDFLSMAETLAKQNKPKGNRLMIISNSIAPSEIAMNVLKNMGGIPATPDKKTLETISAGLTCRRKLHNPLYLPANASAADYQLAMQKCMQDIEVDGVLVICIPFPGIDLIKIAKTIVIAAKSHPNIPLFCTWFGEKTIFKEIEFSSHGRMPICLTPEQAVKNFMYMYRYDNNLKLLLETPKHIIKNRHTKPEVAKNIIADCMDRKRYMLSAEEAAAVIREYGIPVIDMVSACDGDEAVRAARRLGYPVTMKIDAMVAGSMNQEEMVFVHLKDDHEVRKVFRILRDRLISLEDQEARVVVQPVFNRRCYELVVGAQKCQNLGTVIKFGLGGKYFRAESDYSIGLPPLNQTLARQMMEETKIYHCLKAHRYLQKGGLRSLEEILVRFSQLVVDFPQVNMININPLMLTDSDCIVSDVTIQLDKTLPPNYRWAKDEPCPTHLSIPPYPCRYEKNVSLKNGTIIHIRPIRGEDEPALQTFFETLSEESIFFRFGQRRINMPHDHLARLCQVDYDRDLAFLAVVPGEDDVIIGDVRLNRFPDLESAELSFVIADQWQGKGVGSLLMDFCLVVAKEIGLKTILMEVMKSNVRMKQFSYKYDFQISQYNKEDDMEELELKISRLGDDFHPVWQYSGKNRQIRRIQNGDFGRKSTY